MKKTGISEPNWLLIITFFLGGMFFGGLSVLLWTNITQKNQSFRIHPFNNQYKFTNPLLAVDSAQKSLLTTDHALELELGGLIDERTGKGDITRASVYFRDIESGNWIGINENEKFSPGTFLKIPIMISYYKLAEDNPEALTRIIKVTAKDIGVGSTLSPGDYSIDSLIDNMIQNSDEMSATILFDNIDKRFLDETYSDLGVGFQEDKTNADFISTKAYSLFYRVLYNASYLSRAMSEKALNLLTQTDTEYGISSPLPQSISVAHSKGYRKLAGQKEFEMRDCGIIYYPQHPYVLCAIVRGQDMKPLKQALSDISDLAYQDIDYRYKNVNN